MEFADNKLNDLFGSALKEARGDIGISQQDLALDCGLDRTYISLLERGLRQPTIKTLFRLSTRLGVKPSSLIQKIEDSI